MLEPTPTSFTRVGAGENPWASNSGNRGWFVLPRRGVKNTKITKARTLYIYNLFPRSTKGMCPSRREQPIKILLKPLSISHLTSAISYKVTHATKMKRLLRRKKPIDNGIRLASTGPCSASSMIKTSENFEPLSKRQLTEPSTLSLIHI